MLDGTPCAGEKISAKISTGIFTGNDGMEAADGARQSVNCGKVVGVPVHGSRSIDHRSGEPAEIDDTYGLA